MGVEIHPHLVHKGLNMRFVGRVLQGEKRHTYRTRANNGRSQKGAALKYWQQKSEFRRYSSNLRLPCTQALHEN